MIWMNNLYQWVVNQLTFHSVNFKKPKILEEFIRLTKTSGVEKIKLYSEAIDANVH